MLSKYATQFLEKGLTNQNAFRLLSAPQFSTYLKNEPYRNLLKSKKAIQLDMTIRPQHLKKHQHPEVLKIQNQMTQKPEPLKYKLQDLPVEHDPLIPIGNIDHLPFSIQRTKSDNLPVYRDYKNARHEKTTIVRRVSGNFEELMTELRKVTSNSDIEAKVGKIVIKGLHKQVVMDYLTRMGF